jgi:hypothetical protein
MGLLLVAGCGNSLRGTKTSIRRLTSGSLGCSDGLLTPLHGVARLKGTQTVDNVAEQAFPSGLLSPKKGFVGAVRVALSRSSQADSEYKVAA